MYKIFEDTVVPSSRFFIDGEEQSDISPARVGDKIAIKASKDVEFHILIEYRDEQKVQEVQGVIQHIEPYSENGYKGWFIGDKIKVKSTKIYITMNGLIACV